MIDQYLTTVWSDEVSYSIDIRNATVAGSTVTVNALRHHLSSGDPILVSARQPYEDFSTASAVNVLDAHRFEYTLSSAPNIPFPAPKPGQGIMVSSRIPKYSQIMTFPKKVRITVPVDSVVHVEVFENAEWVNKKTIDSTYGLCEIRFKAVWDTVRFKLHSGVLLPTAIALSESAPTQVPADTIVELPEEGVVTNPGEDPVDPFDSNIYATYLNTGSIVIPMGAAVRTTSPATCEMARGIQAERNIIGIAAESISVNGQGRVLIEGSLEMPVPDWQVVTGMEGGLVADGNPYFLSFTVLGKLEKFMDTDQAPTDGYLVSIGFAVSPTEFKLEIEPAIKL